MRMPSNSEAEMIFANYSGDRSKLSISIIAIMLICLFAPPALGHGIWVEGKQNLYSIKYGGHGDNESYDEAAVKGISAFDFQGKLLKLTMYHKNGETSFKTQGIPASISVEFDNGYWIERDGDWFKGTLLDEPNARHVDHAMKYTRALLLPTPQNIEPVKFPLEIVPEVDPLSLSTPSSFKAKVMYMDRPLPNASIEVNFDEKAIIKTDKSGNILLPLSDKPMDCYEVELTRRIDNEKHFNHLFITTTLTISK